MKDNLFRSRLRVLFLLVVVQTVKSQICDLFFTGNCRDCSFFPEICFPVTPEECELSPSTAGFCPRTCNQCYDLNDSGCSALNCSQRCVLDTNNTPRCACYDGFVLDQDGRSCYDINECTKQPDACANSPTGSVCVNTNGSFACTFCNTTENPNSFPYYRRSDCCMIDDTEQCGKSSNNQVPIQSKIVQGYDSRIQMWPWLAYIQLTIDGAPLGGCTGSLIAPRFVLSARHCFDFFPLNISARILLGAIDLFNSSNVNAQYFESSKIHFFSPEVDVAIVELDRPATLNSFVNTICLPNGESPPVGEVCYAAGFGVESNDAFEGPETLKEVDLVIASKEHCRLAYGNLTDDIFCAGEQDGGKSACFGDSGGALACQRCTNCNWYVSGIVSFGFVCGAAGYYSAFVNVTYLEPWILNITQQEPGNITACEKTTWAPWQPWSTCSATCGPGTRTRTRTCVVRSPGTTCLGSSQETGTCMFLECFTPFNCTGQNCSQLCLPDFLNINNTRGVCGCRAGFQLGSDNKTCLDVNECEQSPNSCQNGNCYNTAGSFFCSLCNARDIPNVFAAYTITGVTGKCCIKNSSTNCGKSSSNQGLQPSTRILGGVPSHPQRWPWMAYIFVLGKQGCTGSLIAPQFVLTSAECAKSITPQTPFVVILGATDSSINNLKITENSQIFYSGNVSFHPNYSNPFNSVAVIQLEKPAQLNEFVNIVCLPGGEVPSGGDICYITGFGASFPLRTPYLHEIAVTIDASCPFLPIEFFCSVYDPVSSPCGIIDLGAPVVCQRCRNCDWYQAGIVTNDLQCNLFGIGLYYPKVSIYEDWINSITSQSTQPEPTCTPEWSTWSSWEICSGTCGSTTQKRSRVCLGSDVSGSGCTGNAEDTRPCDPCQGTWSTWSEVRSCPVNCGGGMRFFARHCEGTVEPEECGIERRAERCNTIPCCEGLTDNYPGCCSFTLENCNDDSTPVNASCSLSCCRKREGLNCQDGGIGAGCDRESNSVYCFLVRSKCMEPTIQSLCPSTCSNQGSCVCREEQRTNNLC